MNEFLKMKDDIDTETAKKIKALLKKYKLAQDDVIEGISAVVVENLDDGNLIFVREAMTQEMKETIKNRLSEFAADERDFLQDVLSNAYTTAATKTAAALGIKADWHILRKEFIDSAINTPIDGKRFSERIWDNTNDLATRIYNDILDCVRTGKRPSEIARKIKDDFGKSAFQATRLVNTELARTVNDAQLEIYKNSGVVDKVMWCATLEDNTCEDCGGMDGKTFQLNHVPRLPMHPNCRCCFIPIVDGYVPSQRADNETKQNIDFTTFSEWENNK